LLILQVLIFLIFGLFFWCWFKGEILGVRYFLIWLQFQLGSSDAYSNQLLSLACLNGYNVFSRIYFDGSASRQVRWSISTELAGTFRMASVERTGNSVEPSIFTGALAYFQLRSPSYLTITLCSVGLHIHADSCHLIWSCFRQRIR
jgi:hypothetical protein